MAILVALVVAPVQAQTFRSLFSFFKGLFGGGGGGTTTPVVPPGNKPQTIAVFGNWPYSQTLLNNKTDLINSVNNDVDVVLSVHLGGTHSGSMPCSGAGIGVAASVTPVSEFLDGRPTPLSTFQNAFVRNNAPFSLLFVCAPLPTECLSLPTPPQPLCSVNPSWNIHIFNAFKQFQKPLVYTPGGNEWSDCHKSKQYSSGAPLAELANVRELFFARPGQTLGVNPITLMSQSVTSSDPNDSRFVENNMWVQEGVVYATFHFPSGSNNDDETAFPWTGIYSNAIGQKDERLRREAANLRWMESAFFRAQSESAKAIVLMTQPDMWDTEKFPNLTNFAQWVQRLAGLCIAYGKPVLVLNGDTRFSKVDTPLVSNGAPSDITPFCDLSINPGARCDLATIYRTLSVTNLLRIAVKGSGVEGQLTWVKLRVDTSAADIRDVFSHTEVCYSNC